MTREELKTHCIKQVEQCEMWAKLHGIKPRGKIYEEHKLILELLEQERILDKIRAEIEEYKSRQLTLAIGVDDLEEGKQISIEYVLAIIDKYKAESEVENENF